MPEAETDVAIVGGGPVGLCLAIDLGSRGVDCIVVERRKRGAKTFPTANHISTRTMEHLRRLGLADEVRAAFRPDWGGHWIALTYIGGPEVARVDDALASSSPRPDSPEHEVWAPKPCFDPILERAAEAYDTTDLRFGTSVDRVETEADHVRCITADGTRIGARYVVACDGAGSSVRRAHGIEMVGPPALPIRVHSAFFRSKRVTDLVPPGVQYSLLGTPSGPIETPVGAGLMVAVDGYGLWRLHGPGLNADDEAASLQHLIALGADDAEILAMSAWTPSQGLSTQFRSGRVFFAGDAAHEVTPFGGLGVNTGMADAFDLGWKLEATLRGWGGPALLESSYHYERRSAAIDLLRYQGVEYSGAEPTRLRLPLPIYDAPDESLWKPGVEGTAARRAYGQGLVASRGNEYVKPQIDLGYRYDGSPIICDDDSPSPDRSNVREYRATTRPGGRAPHIQLAGGRSSLDLFGQGFTLVRTDTTTDPSLLEEAAKQRGIPLRVETVPKTRELYTRALTLVRPDGFVAWRGDEVPKEPATVLDIVRGS